MKRRNLNTILKYPPKILPKMQFFDWFVHDKSASRMTKCNIPSDVEVATGFRIRSSWLFLCPTHLGLPCINTPILNIQQDNMRHDIYFNIKEYEVFSTTIGVTVYIMYSALFINKFIKSAKVEFPLPPTKIQGLLFTWCFLISTSKVSIANTVW